MNVNEAPPLRIRERRVHAEWFAVRCCCEAPKILGFLLLDRDSEATTTVRDHSGEVHVIEIRDAGGSHADRHQRTITRERSIYSDDRDVAFWRTIPGFIEVLT